MYLNLFDDLDLQKVTHDYLVMFSSRSNLNKLQNDGEFEFSNGEEWDIHEENPLFDSIILLSIMDCGKYMSFVDHYQF